MSSGKQHIDTGLLTRYFSGETSQEENREVEEWIAQSKNNLKEYNQVKQAWDLMDKTYRGREIDIEKEWKYLQSKIHLHADNRKRIFVIRRVLQIAATILILLGVGLISRQFYTIKSVNTKVAETREIILPDGSNVTLNAGSKITYTKNYASLNRQVKLKGEAYFEVKKDTSLPFIISLNKAEIEVLGTSFNVKAYKKSDVVEVTVTEGKVSLYDKDIRAKKVVATVGEKATYNYSQKIVRKTSNRNQNYMAWKTHKIIFDNDNLSKVVETIGEVYHQKLVLTNDNIANCTITTDFEEEDIETVLKVLESTLDVTIEQKNHIYYLSGEGCE